MKLVGTSLAAALCLLLAQAAVAGDCCEEACCEQACCAKPCCEKACNVVCGTKKVERHVWVVQCEEFCAPLPGCDRGCKCRDCCGECGEDADCGACDGCGKCGEDPCEALLDRKYIKPKCGKVRVRKKLIRKTVICEIPSYKCVVCGSACGPPACGEEDAPEAAPAEEAPAAAPEAAPAEPPAPATTLNAPMPSVIGTSYLKMLKVRI